MPMEITAQVVKELRDRTGAGIMDCRKALQETEGDMRKAEALLREKSLLGPKDPSRETRQGLVEAYIHRGGQVGALVEVNCETDFVARTDDFKELAREVALQVAGLDTTRYIERGQVPEEELAQRRAEFEEQLRLDKDLVEADLPAKLQARVERYIQDVALLEQPYLRDPKQTIQQLIRGVAAKTGENIRVARFARFKVGG